MVREDDGSVALGCPAQSNMEGAVQSLNVLLLRGQQTQGLSHGPWDVHSQHRRKHGVHLQPATRAWGLAVVEVSDQEPRPEQERKREGKGLSLLVQREEPQVKRYHQWHQTLGEARHYSPSPTPLHLHHPRNRGLLHMHVSAHLWPQVITPKMGI